MKMSQLSSTIVLLYLITLLFPNVFTAKCDPDTTINDHSCSADTYEQGSDYSVEVDRGLDELVYMTIDEPNKQKSLTGSYAAGFAYCQPQLFERDTDCIICLEAAGDFLRRQCVLSMAAWVAMTDCGMGYGPIPQGN